MEQPEHWYANYEGGYNTSVAACLLQTAMSVFAKEDISNLVAPSAQNKIKDPHGRDVEVTAVTTERGTRLSFKHGAVEVYGILKTI